MWIEITREETEAAMRALRRWAPDEPSLLAFWGGALRYFRRDKRAASFAGVEVVWGRIVAETAAVVQAGKERAA